MKQRIKHRTSCFVLLAIGFIATLALSGCSKDDATAGDLPDGKYPMTFTAAVEGLTATKAGTTADNTWTVNDQVAISTAADGSNPKTYKITDAATGAMSSINESNTLYWQTSTNQPIRAWYPYNATRPTSFTVKENQNDADGFQLSDMLYTSQSITYSSTAPELKFKHLPVKVVVNLKADTQNGVKAEEVQGATVTIVNQALTSGMIDVDGTVAQAVADTKNITPKVNGTATSGYQKTVQALLVPQQMQNTKFIKVTVGSSTYYYTPANNDANLEHGKQYTYNITVKKDKLEVTTVSGAWTSDVTTGNATEAVFRVKCPSPADKVSDFAIKEAGNASLIKYNPSVGAYEISTSTFTISYKLATGTPIYFRYLLDKGVAAVDRSATGDQITLTVTIRGDLEFTTAENTMVGDYYYNNGTWSDTWYPDRTCVGIVFYAGAGNGDAPNLYDSKLSGEIHGYVVSLQNNADLRWGADSQTPIETSQDIEAFNGYSNSKTIINYGEYKQTNYPAPFACMNYNVSAGSNNSGWYMPSAAQLIACVKNKNLIEAQLLKAGGAWLQNDSQSSTWESGPHYQVVNVGNATVSRMYWANPRSSRSIFTF